LNSRKKFTPDIFEATEILKNYKRGKHELEDRISVEREFWQKRCSPTSNDSSSWLFNSIVNKHADIIDNMPACSCLPREECDEKDAELLSKIIPIIIDRCNFKGIYSDNAWMKLKYGTAIYGVFWNNALEDGLGDIDIRALRVEDVFWEPGIRDIQDSKHVFVCGIWDRDTLEHTYPDVNLSESKRESDNIGYELYGGTFDSENKYVVVDWYYKKFGNDGMQRLHLCKFCGNKVLYCSENMPECSVGWYEHGQYPIIFDSLYPDENNIHGFGVISVAKNAQTAIDKIDQNLMEYSDWSSRARFWAKKSLGVNEKDFRDLSKSIVEVEGDIDEEKLKQIEIARLDDSVLELRGLKIDELKETTGTRDFLQGGTTGGVVAATAIKRLQDSGAKYSRDGIEGSCRAYAKIISLIIELIRQFYDTPRYFRVKGECGDNRYICFTGISPDKNRSKTRGGDLIRRPYFDIEISTSQKSTGYAESANAFAKELYDSGAFKTENADQTLIMLELMNFEGIGKIKKMVRELREVSVSEHNNND